MSFQADTSSIQVRKNLRRQELVEITDHEGTIKIIFPELKDTFFMIDLVVRDQAIVLEVLDWREYGEQPPRKEIVLYEYPKQESINES